MASAWERRKLVQVVAARPGAGSIPASLKISHCGGGHLYPEHEQLTMHPPVPP